jgi:hypothetical protein
MRGRDGLIAVPHRYSRTGVAAKQLADQWAGSPASERAVTLALVSANETTNFALAGLFNMSFAGVPFILLGLAVAFSNAYPRWLGWMAAAAGTGSIAAGALQAFTVNRQSHHSC